MGEVSLYPLQIRTRLLCSLSAIPNELSSVPPDYSFARHNMAAVGYKGDWGAAISNGMKSLMVNPASDLSTIWELPGVIYI